MKKQFAFKDTLICLILVGAAAWLRWKFLTAITANPASINYGGDPAHHFNIANNVAHGRGPVTDFIFSFWFRHPKLPALTDIYPPGVHYVLAAFLKFFRNDFATARFVCLGFGSLAPALVYLLARQFLGYVLAFVAAALLVLNPVHLEHSTVVMTPVIASFFVWLTLLVYLRVSGAPFWKGMLAGWSHLCMSALPALAFSFLVGEGWSAMRRRPRFARLRAGIGLFIVGAGLVLAPWAIRTSLYFGKPFYSNFNFYPVVHSWVPMNYETVAPTAKAFIDSNGGLTGTLSLYMVEFARAAEVTYLQAFPLAAPTPIGWEFTPGLLLLAAGVWQLFRLNRRGGLLLISFFFPLLALTALGSTGLGGHLSTRHVIVFVPFVMIGWALGLDFIRAALVRHVPSLRVQLSPSSARMIPQVALAIVMVAFAVETSSWAGNFQTWRRNNSELYAFWWFWKRSYPELEEAASWIRNNTPKTTVLMYGSTPQDLWALTRRPVVIDPVYAGGNPLRAAEEAKYYEVHYLVLDASDTIYRRNPLPANVNQAYPGLNLLPVWGNQKNTIQIYKIQPE